MTKISVAIATRNEESDIKDCLESVKWADEIVIFDEKSTDKTVSIAKKYTNLVFSTDHDPMFHRTKQKAVVKSTGDWILSLDADERVTEELKKEIFDKVNSKDAQAGYQFPRKSKIFGKWIEHSGWYPDYQVKLFKKGKGHYPCQSIHEMISIDGQIGMMEHDLLHMHYSTIDWFLNRRFEYTKDDAQNMISSGQKIVWFDAIKFPADEFFKRFFYWEGYKDGLHGLVLSLFMAFDRLIVFARIWENQKFWQFGNENFLNELTIKSKGVSHDLNHYLAASTKNPIKKALYKLRSRIT